MNEVVYTLSGKDMTIFDIKEYIGEIVKQCKDCSIGIDVPVSFEHIGRAFRHSEDPNFFKVAAMMLQEEYINTGGYNKYLLDIGAFKKEEIQQFNKKIQQQDECIREILDSYKNDKSDKKFSRTSQYRKLSKIAGRMGFTVTEMLKFYNLSELVS